MAFTLGKLRYIHALKAYKTYARVHGLPIRRIRESLCRRQESGNWVLHDEQGAVAIVTPRVDVKIVTQFVDSTRTTIEG